MEKLRQGTVLHLGVKGVDDDDDDDDDDEDDDDDDETKPCQWFYRGTILDYISYKLAQLLTRENIVSPVKMVRRLRCS
jgi:hypothetical protein